MHSFSVFTLNCWGVFTPLACEKKNERIAAIAKLLETSTYEIVLLQEIWTDGDYKKIRDASKVNYPHANYFHSNLIGSGCCIFSKFPIEETFYYRYSANGFPHRIQHGDWFGGKGVGLAKLRIPFGPGADSSGGNGFLVSVYMTHLHAEYSRTKDEYLSHRLTQAYELSTFIRMTSMGSDAAILGGDLNLCPDKLGYQVIILNSGLTDAWINNDKFHLQADKDGISCDREGNSFSSKTQPFPERLDYILYGSLAGAQLKCLSCEQPLGKVPDGGYSYSDHEAVAAQFELTRSVTSQGSLSDVDAEQRRKALSATLVPLKEGLSAVMKARLYYSVCLLLTLVLLVCNSRLLGGGIIGTCVTIAASIYTFFLVWTVVVVKTAERRALTNTLQDIERRLACSS